MAAQSGTYNRGLLVHDSGNRVWLLDVAECGTWLVGASESYRD